MQKESDEGVISNKIGKMLLQHLIGRVIVWRRKMMRPSYIPLAQGFLASLRFFFLFSCSFACPTSFRALSTALGSNSILSSSLPLRPPLVLPFFVGVVVDDFVVCPAAVTPHREIGDPRPGAHTYAIEYLDRRLHLLLVFVLAVVGR